VDSLPQRKHTASLTKNTWLMLRKGIAGNPKNTLSIENADFLKVKVVVHVDSLVPGGTCRHGYLT
jgi:hypothetical protein